MKRPWPAALGWLEQQTSPALRWLSAGQRVTADSVADWLVQA